VEVVVTLFFLYYFIFLLQERKDALDKLKQKEQENASIKDSNQGEIEKSVKVWSMDKKRSDRELSFPELLRDLAFILPPDLLLVVYDSPNKPLLDALLDFSVNSNPSEVQS
jgi:hypothetical protein